MIKNLYKKASGFKLTERRKKVLYRSFVFITASFLTLTYMSGVIASSGGEYDWCFNSTTGYEDENEISDIETTDQAMDGDNLTRTSGNANANFAMSIVLRDVNCNYEAVAASGEISDVGKMGLVSFADRTVMALVQNPPTQDVYAHLVDDWVPGQDKSTTGVYAGGYEDLMNTGIDDLWETVRNISYLVFVLILIASGFMIMFRQKIGGQLAVTIFNTLPSVLVSLILVTFSFAIVGLMINLGGVLLNVIASFFGLASPADGIMATGPFSLFTAALRGDGLMGSIEVWGGGSAIIGIVASIVALSGGTVLPVVAGVVAVGGIIVALLALVLAGIVIGASIKVFITLLKAYIGLLIDTILGPLYLTFGAFPGKGNMRTDWLKRIAKNVLTFPVVFFFLNLGAWVFTSDFNFSLPPTLMGGVDTGSIESGDLLMTIMRGAVMIYLFYVAGNVPKMLDDLFPVAGGKGTAEALQGAAKGAFGKIPIIGGQLG